MTLIGRYGTGRMAQTTSTILCIEDDPNALEIRALLLRSVGYGVLSASDSEQAMRLFETEDVELVLSDHFLGESNGSELASRMKARKPSVPIVLLSGAPELAEEVDCADRFLVKGQPVPEMLAAIEDLLRKRGSGKGERFA